MASLILGSFASDNTTSILSTMKSLHTLIKILFVIHSAMPLAGLAQSQSTIVRSQKPTVWQLSDVCDVRADVVNSTSNSSEEILKEKCYGVNVSQGSNLNIHFSSAHPSLEDPIISYVLVEGPFNNNFPVRLAVMLLGNGEQVILDAETGMCAIVVRSNSLSRRFIQCSIVTSPRQDGTYLRIIATAMFDAGLAPQLKSLLE
jgi:hypothetical protein